MNRIGVFVSGSGSNAENIISYFKGNKEVEISLVLSDKAEAYGLQRAKNHNIPAFSFNRADFLNTTSVLDLLNEYRVDFIVLAGFLCYVPNYIIDNYKGRIVNIHPSLLPKFGGKGMYGTKIHQAVVAHGEKESGITIHHVNDKFDDGEVIFQAKCEVLEKDGYEEVEKKVRALEIKHFPRVIETVLAGL